MKTHKLIFAFAFLASGFRGYATVDHDAFNQLLAKYVSSDGLVDYPSFAADSLSLNNYLETMGKAVPDDTWLPQEQMAYWINVYNASVIQLVIRNYPLTSIRDISKKLKKINSVFDWKYIALGGENFSLNEIENKLLKDFDEPRILFALNNASKSAPNLRKEVYTADRLDAQLTDQLKKFLADTSKNKVTEPHAELSKIFQWHRGHFTKDTSFEGFISRYAPDIITFDTLIEFKGWDWGLNE